MDSIPCKQCAECKVSQPTSAFHRSSQRKDGLSAYCRECANARSLAQYHKHRAERLAYGRAWRARTRGQQTEAQRTHRQAWERAWRATHQDERSRLQRDWRERHRADVAAYKRRWVSDNRDLVREAMRRRYVRQRAGTIIPFTVEQLQARLAYWGNRCWMCGVPATCIDHVKPLAKGGAHALCNIRPACQPCNLRKKDTWPLARV